MVAKTADSPLAIGLRELVIYLHDTGDVGITKKIVDTAIDLYEDERKIKISANRKEIKGALYTCLLRYAELAQMDTDRLALTTEIDVLNPHSGPGPLRAHNADENDQYQKLSEGPFREMNRDRIEAAVRFGKLQTIARMQRNGINLNNVDANSQEFADAVRNDFPILLYNGKTNEREDFREELDDPRSLLFRGVPKDKIIVDGQFTDEDGKTEILAGAHQVQHAYQLLAKDQRFHEAKSLGIFAQPGHFIRVMLHEAHYRKKYADVLDRKVAIYLIPVIPRVAEPEKNLPDSRGIHAQNDLSKALDALLVHPERRNVSTTLPRIENLSM